MRYSAEKPLFFRASQKCHSTSARNAHICTHTHTKKKLQPCCNHHFNAANSGSSGAGFDTVWIHQLFKVAKHWQRPQTLKLLSQTLHVWNSIMTYIHGWMYNGTIYTWSVRSWAKQERVFPFACLYRNQAANEVFRFGFWRPDRRTKALYSIGKSKAGHSNWQLIRSVDLTKTIGRVI